MTQHNMTPNRLAQLAGVKLNENLSTEHLAHHDYHGYLSQIETVVNSAWSKEDKLAKLEEFKNGHFDKVSKLNDDDAHRDIGLSEKLISFSLKL